MRSIITDRVAWSVGLSVGQSVTLVQKRLNRMRCRLGWGLGWAREPCIRLVQIPAWKGAIFEERRRRSHCKYVTAARHYRCSQSNAERSFYRAFSAMFGKIGRCASEEIIVELLKMKCLPVIFYGLESCPFNTRRPASADRTARSQGQVVEVNVA